MRIGSALLWNEKQNPMERFFGADYPAKGARSCCNKRKMKTARLIDEAAESSFILSARMQIESIKSLPNEAFRFSRQQQPVMGCAR